MHPTFSLSKIFGPVLAVVFIVELAARQAIARFDNTTNNNHIGFVHSLGHTDRPTTEHQVEKEPEPYFNTAIFVATMGFLVKNPSKVA